jgi:hypothetical protein
MNRFWLIFFIFGTGGVLVACTEKPPQGRWEALETVDVYAEKFNLSKVAFRVKKGEICAIGEKWHADKEQGYKEIICPQGRGWVANTELFKKISD